ncbi:MAG: transposase [Actinobacteria bacterium]|nr:transposase [Actinomycetota bacterium]
MGADRRGRLKGRAARGGRSDHRARTARQRRRRCPAGAARDADRDGHRVLEDADRGDRVRRKRRRPSGPGRDAAHARAAARGRIDLDRVRRHWEDILRVVASIYTGTVRAYDVVRMLQRDGNPTPLGEAIASYGRIFKSLHVLVYIDDETYRRDIKGVRNLQEGRHSLAATVFHGKKGELYERYHKGMLAISRMRCAARRRRRPMDAAVIAVCALPRLRAPSSRAAGMPAVPLPYARRCS